MRRAALFLILLTACGAQGEVRGLVTAVDGDLDSVTSFTVQADGISYVFVPAADGEFDFPLPHLREHLRSTEAVLVTYRDAGDRLEATAVADG